MITFRRCCLLALILLALVQTRSPAVTALPPNPHQFMRAPGACAGCHGSNKGGLLPHEFIVNIPEKCWKCHPEEKLGRSHPIGVDPDRSPQTIKIPEELPLENGMVSCGSCHNPHGAFLARTKCFRDQHVTFVQVVGRLEIPWYKTLFLRKSDPIKGFEPLCLACHMDY